MLGELYRPRGLALETATAVLETEQVYACNVAFGCSNKCGYCYVNKYTRRRRYACEVRLPTKPPVELVRHQLEHQWRFHFAKGKKEIGVFLSFMTDPFLPKLFDATEDLLKMLVFHYGFTVATLSKVQTSVWGTKFPSIEQMRHGITLVSFDEAFWQQFEPKTTRPYNRLVFLKAKKELYSGYVWVSMEPYPPSAICKQNLTNLLNELNFVDLIIFGMWNYDKRARTEQARQEYAEDITVLTDFCKSHHIRLHIKSDTLRFVEKIKGETRD